MLRDKSLIPLSHQHQHALALCVRIDRGSPIPETDLAAWQSELAQIFATEIAIHFAAEEQVVFPAASEFKELAVLVSDLLREHVELRALFGRAKKDDLGAAELLSFAQKLANHIRKEERQLFEMLQQLLSEERLRDLGQKLDIALKGAATACILPSKSTRLRPANKRSRKDH